MNDFLQDLAYSQSQADQPWWQEVYQRAFPNLASITNVRNDGWAQRGGIDRVLVLTSGKPLWIDEKVRRKDYGDIILEDWSNWERRQPGWICKELACDYIAYAIEPRGICYLLPFQQLQLAWRTYGETWVELFPRVKATNNGYTTYSVAVPAEEVLAALTKAMTISFALVAT